MIKSICVYGASSNAIEPVYISSAELIGEKLAEKNIELIFGAGASGVMGATARGVVRKGGKLTGVAPKFFNADGVLFENCTKLIYTTTMRERKQLLEDLAGGFIVAPGGVGTYDEFFEILTLKQLCRHDKPIVIYNLQGYYNELYAMLETATDKKFLRQGSLELFKMYDDLEDLFSYLENYKPTNRSIKDLKDG